MEIRKFSFITLLSLIIIIFFLGFGIGHFTKNEDIDEIQKIIRDSELRTESFFLEQEFLKRNEKICDLTLETLSDLSGKLWKLGKVLGTETAESDLGKEKYDLLKRKYHLMQIRTFFLYKELDEKCDIETSAVLFYFSRNDEMSKEQGIVLDKLVQEKGIKVFAIEYGFSSELEFLEDFYNIKKTPALILKYDLKLEGFTPYEKLKRTL